MRLNILKACLLASVTIAAIPAALAGSIHAGLAQDKSNPGLILVAGKGDEVSQGAENFIKKMTDEGVSFLADPESNMGKKKAAFQQLLTKNFDMNTIARFSLGTYWKQASQSQRDEYLKLFRNMIVEVYAKRFEEYQGQTIEVVGSRKEGENDVIVQSKLVQESGPAVKLDWRVRKRDGKYQVVDVIVEGVSMALTQRSDFASVIQRGGGDMEALLVHLRS